MGKITNEFDAPLPFVAACGGSSWKPNENKLYVTQLFAPPMIRRLTIDHFDEIETDVIDLYYRILGSATHSVCQKALEGKIGVQTELRVAMPKEWFGIEITGRIDYINYFTSTLADIKTSSVAIHGRGIKDDWVAQANIYRYMLYRIHDYKVDNLEVYPLYRDWSGAKAGKDHPVSPYGCIELPIWPIKETHAFIEKCVADNMVEKVRFCNDEERWKTPDSYAVKKKGAVKAVAATTMIDGERVPIPTKEIATEIMNSKKNSKELSVEFRPGGCRRCTGYCDVKAICKKVNKAQWAKDKKGTKDES